MALPLLFLQLNHEHAWRIDNAMDLLTSFFPSAAEAHERFVKHDLLQPIRSEFFHGLDPNLLSISLRVYVAMALLLFLWLAREPIAHWLLGGAMPDGRRHRWLRAVYAFFADKPLEGAAFVRMGDWAYGFLMRSPALVLMYSAANYALIMPSFPLERSTAAVFQYAQVLAAIAIITQTALPFIGAAIFGTFFLYLLPAYGWSVAVDVLPVLTIALVYVSSPCRLFGNEAPRLTPRQVRWVRLTLGFSFLALGWMKAYNHELIIGLADNYPWVMDDLLIKLFYAGTDPRCQRECWSVAFAGCEVMAGFLIMLGVFTRFWAVQMVLIFGKLMVVDFGWAEIPHVYPIAGFLVLAVSNHLSDELHGVGALAAHVASEGKRKTRTWIASAVASILPLLALVPMSYLVMLIARR